jgi:hypothetical protein
MTEKLRNLTILWSALALILLIFSLLAGGLLALHPPLHPLPMPPLHPLPMPPLQPLPMPLHPPPAGVWGFVVLSAVIALPFLIVTIFRMPGGLFRAGCWGFPAGTTGLPEPGR